MKASLSLLLAVITSIVFQPPAHAELFARPAPGRDFTDRISNNWPLEFGMDVSEASLALGGPLHYIRGRPGNEIYLAIRNTAGSGLFFRNDRLYLKFRSGRLTGWKGDYGQNWMWR